MASMQVFTFPVTSQEIRVSGTHDDPWFCLTDVCIVLDLTNPSWIAQKSLKPDGITKIDTIDSMGRTQNVLFINEANLYRCVMRSNKPNAVDFQDWLVEHVLPSIRKTGSFGDAPNHESSESEFLQVIKGAIAYGIEPERMVDLYHRFNGNKNPGNEVAQTVPQVQPKVWSSSSSVDRDIANFCNQFNFALYPGGVKASFFYDQYLKWTRFETKIGLQQFGSSIRRNKTLETKRRKNGWHYFQA